MPPRALSTPAEYPSSETTSERVELELLIDAEGKVSQARATAGRSPFREHAEAAATTWRFDPALRAGKPVPARIRFALTFEPPVEEAEPEPEQEAGSAEPSKPRKKAKVVPEMEVVVLGDRQPLRRRLSRVDVQELPGAFGDAYRAIEVLPGVVPIASGVPYFYVRGAPPGNIGYFFDDIPVPLLYHFAAGPSVLHPAFVGNVDLFPGAYPARHGRFAGGIVAGEIAAPTYRLRGEASVRLIDSGGMLEVPFAEGRGSAMFAGRYSYTAALLSLISPEVNVSYWDYQSRVRYALTPRDSVEILGFGSSDIVTQSDRMPSGKTYTRSIVDLTFHRLALRWERTSATSRLRTAVNLGLDRTRLDEEGVSLRNHLLGVRIDYERALSSRLQWRVGTDGLLQSYRQTASGDPGEREISEPVPGGPGPSNPPPQPVEEDPEPDDAERFGFVPNRTDYVASLYNEFVWSPTPSIQVVPGVRADVFASTGRSAFGVDPRISARFALGHGVVLKHGFGVAHQAPSFVVAIPGAAPSLAGGLQRAVQHSAGVEYGLPLGIQASFTLFQNLFFNMTDFLGLIQIQNTLDREDNLRMGGRGIGAEVLLQRSLSNKIGGFLSYTLSRAERYKGELSGPTTTDRTHVFNLALSYDLGKNWRFGNRFMFYTGVPAQVAYLEAARRPPRAPAFYRIDFRLQKRFWYGPERYWGVILEVLNTTLHKETLERSCNAFECEDESFGPVTIPSLGVEGAF